MNFLQLRYFLALAENEHVSKTANMLYISQPSLTATIKKLEKELGVKLFVRKGRSIALSPCGEVFKKYVEEAFLSLENGKKAILKLENSQNNTLNLGILSPYMWSDVIRLFEQRYPNTKINRYSVEEYDYTRDIASEKIDFYLGGINGIGELDSKLLQYRTLYEDDMAVLMNRNHAFAGKKEIELEKCKNEKFINLSKDTNLQKFIDKLCEKAEICPNVVMTCDYTLRDLMVSENHGISITTMQAARKCILPDVTYAKITSPKEKRKLGLVWLKGKEFTNPMQNFYNVLISVYAEVQ